MAEQDQDLTFLSFFLNEPIYLLPQDEQVFLSENNAPAENSAEVEVPSPRAQEVAEVADDVPEVENSLPVPETEGQNRKGVMILFYNPEAPGLEPSSVALLEKILKAVQLDMDDVALCNWALLEQQQAQHNNIFESLQFIDCNKVIAFGDLPLAWSMSHFFKKYHITEDAHAKGLVQADDLTIIAQNRDLKVQLWESLQKLFK